MDKKLDLSTLGHYFNRRNLVLAGGLAISAYCLFQACSKNKTNEILLSHNLPSKHLIPIPYEDTLLWDSIVCDAQYDITLLLQNKPTYEGECKITFDLKEIPQRLFLAFQSDKILSYKINENEIFPGHKNSSEYIIDQRVYLPSQFLKTKSNIVEICYVNDYHNDGSGLSLHIDYDGLPYIYNTSEPLSAHSIFPCFDTLACRGKFKLKIICDEDWTAISNEKVKKTQKLNSPEHSRSYSKFHLQNYENLKEVEFFETKSIMSYLFAIVCGPFHKVDSPKIYKTTESSFYCKKSIAAHLEEQKKEIADLIYHGLNFFESFLGIEYPFSKHDMIYCPNFASVGMEYPGAILFCDEEFLFREEPSYRQRIRRAYITFHEMAHMWFGNLVNVKGYNEIWLKESFASFFGYFAMADPDLKKLYPHGWEDIELYKEDGILLDHYKSLRHGLVRELFPNSEGADFNYDDINYCKGSGVLKVLWASLGTDIFKEVIQNFLSSNTWNSVDRNDFYKSLRTIVERQNVVKFNADSFIKNWLETEGTDTLEVFRGEDDENREVILKIHRDPPYSQRDHYFEIILIYSDLTKEVQTINFSGELDTYNLSIQKDRNLKGVICNYEGLDVLKVKLDNESIEYFIKSFQEVRKIDPKLETYFWRQLTNMVKNFDYPAKDFMKIVKQEIDEKVSSKKFIHAQLISRAKSCLEFVNPDILLELKKYLASQAFTELQKQNIEEESLEYLEQLVENAYEIQHFEFVFQWINKTLSDNNQKFTTYLNLGTELIKNLMQYSFSSKLYDFVDEFFLKTQNHSFEETKRLIKIFPILKKFESKENILSSIFLDDLVSSSIISLRPREKHLLWTLLKKRHFEKFLTREYRKTFFDKAISIYVEFYKFDAYAIFENLFPEFDSNSKDEITDLQNYAIKFKDHETISHFINKNLDHLKYVYLNNN